MLDIDIHRQHTYELEYYYKYCKENKLFINRHKLNLIDFHVYISKK